VIVRAAIVGYRAITVIIFGGRVLVRRVGSMWVGVLVVGHLYSSV